MPVDISNKPKMSQGRRSSKPLMEKRRRARINDSLCQLKSLILEATNKDTSRHSKLEKADILEMTVKYLRNMQRHHISGSGNTDPVMLNRYRLGYSECINEVSRYLDSSEAAVQLRTTLIGHLANSVPVVSQQQQSIAFTPAPTPAPIVATAAMGPTPSLQQQPPTANTTQTFQVQIAPSPVTSASLTPAGNIATASRVVSGTGIPAVFSTGEITVVLPPQAFQGGQLPSHFIPVYAQSAPSLLSPASSTSSQCLPSPAGTPLSPTQTHPVSYQYQQPKVHSPNSFEQQQTLPQTVVATSTGVQTPALLTMPANLLTPPAESTYSISNRQQHQMPATESHSYYQSSPKIALRTVNISVQQQQCPAADMSDENVWRPW